jgi:hypothetical protein
MDYTIEDIRKLPLSERLIIIEKMISTPPTPFLTPTAPPEEEQAPKQQIFFTNPQ